MGAQGGKCLEAWRQRLRPVPVGTGWGLTMPRVALSQGLRLRYLR